MFDENTPSGDVYKIFKSDYTTEYNALSHLICSSNRYYY